MAVTIHHGKDGKCRLISWIADDQGWNDLAPLIDQFLSTVVEEIAIEYSQESVDWLEINYWPDSGRIICFPSIGEPLVNRDERVCLQLCSGYLEKAWAAIADSNLDDKVAAERYETLAELTWGCIRECLLSGAFQNAITKARVMQHRLKVLGYDYEPGEGLHRIDEGGVLHKING